MADKSEIISRNVLLICLSFLLEFRHRSLATFVSAVGDPFMLFVYIC